MLSHPGTMVVGFLLAAWSNEKQASSPGAGYQAILSNREFFLSNQEYAERDRYLGALSEESALYRPAAPAAQTPPSAASALPFAQAAVETAAMLAVMVLVLLIHGYHPWSDDAAIYIAGLRKMMHPSLYPGDAMFVLAHTRVSVFSHILATLAGSFHLSLEHLILTSYLVSVLLFLYATRRFALQVFGDERIGWVATLITAACYTLPVAGTAIFVMDPYLSARSFSTPLSLLAVTAALDRDSSHRWLRTSLWTILTVIMHPQMGVYTAGFIVVLALVDQRRWRAALALSVSAVLGCGALWLATLHAPVTDAYREAVLSRTYFFPGQWQWYEYIGLAAPLLLLGVTWARSASASAVRSIAAASVLVGTAACMAAFSFVHTSGPYLLARIQLLRTFQIIYVLGLILLGGWIARTFSSRRSWVAACLFFGAAAGMYGAELRMYPGSAHLEWPGATPVNPWGEALIWIRSYTPRNAVFAISPSLLDHPAEDLPGFRALAERSVLVDTKDEGIASIFPAVAPAWKKRSETTAAIEEMAQRGDPAAAAARGVQWLLMAPTARTSLPCPYKNSAVAVCSLPH